jgi:hypothetical protein
MLARLISQALYHSITLTIGLSTGILLTSGKAIAQSITPTTSAAILQSVLTGTTPGVTITNLAITANVSGNGGGVGTYNNAGGFTGNGLVLRTGTLNSPNPNTGNLSCAALNCDITTVEFDIVPQYNNLGSMALK